MSQDAKNAGEISRDKNKTALKIDLIPGSPSKLSTAGAGESPGTGAKGDK